MSEYGALLREVIRLDIGAPSLHDRLVAALRAAEEQEKRLRELDQRMIEAAQLLAGPPIFRDFTGTDKKTCGYCHTPLEGFSGKHASDCSWVKALALLASPTLENENMNDSNEHTTDMADLFLPQRWRVVGALEACIRDLEAKLDSLQADARELAETSEALAAELGSLRQQNLDLNVRYKNASDRADSLRKERDRLREALKGLAVSTDPNWCWCDYRHNRSNAHDPACLAASAALDPTMQATEGAE